MAQPVFFGADMLLQQMCFPEERSRLWIISPPCISKGGSTGWWDPLLRWPGAWQGFSLGWVGFPLCGGLVKWALTSPTHALEAARPPSCQK